MMNHMINPDRVFEETEQQTAMNISEALGYLTREAEAAGLDSLAQLIAAAEASAREDARKSAYYLV